MQAFIMQNVLLFSVKLIEYIFSAASVSSNLCVGLLPRIEISFFLLSIFVDELISTPKIFILLPVSPIECEKNHFLSNPVPNPEYLYLSISAFSVKLTAPNKQFSSAG